MIKGQDIVVLASFMDAEPGLAYAELDKRAHISVSEAHAAVKRLEEAGLVNSGRKLVKRNVLEFLVHGLKYAFPLKAEGRLARRLSTCCAEADCASANSPNARCRRCCHERDRGGYHGPVSPRGGLNLGFRRGPNGASAGRL